MENTNINRLAKAFCESVTEYLTREELIEAVSRNAKEVHPDVCHTHDFCDANMAMEEAWDSIFEFGVEIGDVESNSKLWGAAWDLAKNRKFKSS
jgi:hypothetical protein